MTANGSSAAATGLPPLRPHSALLEETFESLAGPNPALPTGFTELDDLTGGITPGELAVLASRPGTGKTTMALTIADHLATDCEETVLYASLEMSARALTLRRMASRAGVPLRRLQRYETTAADDGRIAAAWADLAATRLLIDDARHQPLGALRDRLAQLADAGDPARLLVVDHVGLVRLPSGMPRVELMSAMVKGLRDAAEEHACAVLAVAQLNRGIEARTKRDRAPLLGDLKGTGELEETADLVLLLAADGGDLEVIVAKNRNGDTGSVMLTRQGQYGRVTDHAWSPSRHGA